MIYPIPWSVQIEPTRNCNRRCRMCGIHSTNWKIGEYDFMSPELAKAIATDLNSWIPQGRRIEAALQGEPLINPDIVEIIHNFRQYYPKCQMQITTNGDFITRELVENLFNNGLNMLLVDCYDKFAKVRIQEMLSPLCCYPEKPTNIPSLDFYIDKPKVWTYKGYEQKEIIYMASLMDNDGKTRTRDMNNQAGYSKIPTDKILPLKKPCSNPFREIVVKHDGLIVACCMDWLRKMPVGKFPEQSLKEIWEGKTYNNIRKQLYNCNRTNLELCKICDYSGQKEYIAKHDWKHVFGTDDVVVPKKSRSLFE